MRAVTASIFNTPTIIAYGQTASGKAILGGPRDAKVLAGETVTSPYTHKPGQQQQSQHDETNYQVDPDDGIIPQRFTICSRPTSKYQEGTNGDGGTRIWNLQR
jgi:hypothetical protein